MDLTLGGRLLLGMAVLAFGVQHFVYALLGAGFGPPWTPEAQWLAWALGVVFVGCGVCLLTGRRVRWAALMIGVVALVRAAVYDAPLIVRAIHSPAHWTSGFELVAMGGACLVLAAEFTDGGRGMSMAGKILFACSLVVFGVQHILYGQFIATLIPGWMPWRPFLAWLVGIAFFAAALSILSGRLISLGAGLLGLMFLLWVFVLHGPRVVGAVRNGDEWTSLLVALAMSGGGFLVAGVGQEQG